MAKNIQTKNRQTLNQMARIGISTLDPNELKNVVRDGLVAMTLTDRESFIQSLDAEMRRANLKMSAYLVPLGIPGRTPEDLTPTEVGHLIRFLKINVPQAMPAVERILSRYNILGEKVGHPGDRIAA